MLIRRRCLLIALIGSWAFFAFGDDSQPNLSTPDAKQEQAKPLSKSEQSKPADEDYYELYQIFADTLDQVERNYVKPVSRRELMEAAIAGVLSKLDPYSSYIGREDISRFKSTVESHFGGIGIQIAVDHDQLRVLSPLVGTPAYRAGLQAGDSILEIEGKSTEGLTTEEAVRRLKGDIGTSVTLTVFHNGSGKRESVTIKRELIHVDTVLGDRRKDDDTWNFMFDGDKRIGYIRITAFSRDTAADLKKALDDLKSRGLSGLILDMRFNPGGLLTSAIEVSDLFVAKGRIVSTQGRNTPERTWEAQEPGTFEDFPVAVLVNRFSASASEIVAACLQDHHRAVVIGERTWGKGSVQNIIDLENGRSALKLTTASYRRPSGKNIHRFPDSKDGDEWGVKPDDGFEIKLNPSESESLFLYRRDRDILVARVSPSVDEKPAEAKESTETQQPTKSAQPFVDRQLQKAVDYLTQELARAQ